MHEADTLELSGPAVFTDVVSQFIAPHASPALQRSHPSAILPRVAWGANPAGFDGVLPTDVGVLLQHHFSSSWRPAVRCRAQPWWGRPERGVQRPQPHHAAPARMRHSARSAGAPAQLAGSAAEHVAGHTAAAVPRWYVPRLSGILMSRDFWSWSSPMHYARCATRLARPRALTADERAVLYEPVAVTVPSAPPFTMLVHQKGYTFGLAPDGRDESYEISSHGMSQSGGPPSSADVPSVHDALLGFLTARGSPRVSRAAKRALLQAREAAANAAATTSPAPTATALPKKQPETLTKQFTKPAQPPPRASTLTELFADILGRAPVLVDAGAGLGLTTLAAVSRGVGALALEGGPASVSLLEGSLRVLEGGGGLRAPAALLRMAPGQDRGVRCAEHHLPMSAYVSADRSLNRGPASAGGAPGGGSGGGPLNVVAGKGVFGALRWYSELVATLAGQGNARSCDEFQLPIVRGAVDDEVTELLRAGHTIGGVRIAANDKLRHAVRGAERLLGGRLPGPPGFRGALRPGGPAARNLSASGPNNTHTVALEGGHGADAGSDVDSGAERGAFFDEPQCTAPIGGASGDTAAGAAVGCGGDAVSRRLQGIGGGASAGAPSLAQAPWVVQIDVNPTALRTLLFASTPAELLEHVMGMGYDLRVYHWGPACQQRVAAAQRRRQRGEAAGDVAAYWCSAHGAGGARAAVARIPTRRTEHFIFVHRDIAALSAALTGGGAVDWMETLDAVSLSEDA